MQTQKSSTDTYVLGQAPEAIQRLLKQGQLLNPFTRRVLEEAGLPAPQMRYEAVLAGGPASPIYELVADTVRALLPMLVKFGIATQEEVDIETLADRLRMEIASHHGVARSPALVSAWVRKL